MVKHFKEEFKSEEICQTEKLQQKAQLLATLIRKDHIKDRKKHCLKKGVEYKRQPITLHDIITSVSQLSAAKVKDDVQR